MTDTPYRTSIAQLTDLEKYIGQEVGLSEWVTIDQDMINAFAKLTRDEQWIHVDVERAKRESPFGGPVAHGYLTLSLLAPKAQRRLSTMGLIKFASLPLWRWGRKFVFTQNLSQ